jgi:hypothetical protein
MAPATDVGGVGLGAELQPATASTTANAVTQALQLPLHHTIASLSRYRWLRINRTLAAPW